ncbi:MAG: glucose-6-phosphate isomerase family protein [Patescibacteria group bacterium]
MEIRYLDGIKEVLYDKKWAGSAGNPELYYMHRGIKEKKGLRYDITIIPPQMLGKEFTKTLGHEHSDNFGEIYTVLSGKAVYLIQKVKKNKVEDVYIVKAKKGESAIIPSGYGHITINASEKILKESNWLAKNCKNIYDVFLKNHGACYYYTDKGWIKNKNYKSVPKLRFKKPLKSIPKNLDFLYGKNN